MKVFWLTRLVTFGWELWDYIIISLPMSKHLYFKIGSAIRSVILVYNSLRNDFIIDILVLFFKPLIIWKGLASVQYLQWRQVKRCLCLNTDMCTCMYYMLLNIVIQTLILFHQRTTDWLTHWLTYFQGWCLPLVLLNWALHLPLLQSDHKLEK